VAQGFVGDDLKLRAIKGKTERLTRPQQPRSLVYNHKF